MLEEMPAYLLEEWAEYYKVRSWEHEQAKKRK